MCEHEGTCIWGDNDEDRVWDAANEAWGDADCIEFQTSVERRTEAMKIEGWGVYVWGGIFDTITSVPFPGR